MSTTLKLFLTQYFDAFNPFVFIQFLRALQFSPATNCRRLFETEPATFAPSARSFASASSRDIFSSVPVITYVLPASGKIGLFQNRRFYFDVFQKPLDERDIVFVVEPIVDRLRDECVADAVNTAEFVDTRLRYLVDRTVRIRK